MTEPLDPADLAWHEGDRIRKAREVRGMSQTQLAEAAALSRQSVSNYEVTGRVRRPSRRLLALALDVPEMWLETGQMSPSTGPEDRP